MQKYWTTEKTMRSYSLKRSRLLKFCVEVDDDECSAPKHLPETELLLVLILVSL
jgi:hypothetical protein